MSFRVVLPRGVRRAVGVETSLIRALAGLAFMLTLVFAGAPGFAHSAPEGFADLADKLLPAVVNIATTQVIQSRTEGDQQFDDMFRDFFDKQGKKSETHRSTSLGSGFIVDPAGYIVTNNHVIADADEVMVRLYDDTNLRAQIVGRDEKTDLALLKVDAKHPLPFVKWGNSDAARIGDWIIAIGNPFGLGGSVSAGIVSARQREINAGPYDDFIQTDAAINRGNSGGPMFDMDGEVIGINTAIYSPSGGSVGIGFAVPANLAKPVIDQIREFGHTRRGWLGVNIQTVTDELAEGLHLDKARGALVANVTEKGPAAEAGIQKGDVVLSFDGKDVTDMHRLPRMVAETPIDRAVDVVIWRQGKELKLTAKVGELDESQESALATQAAPPEEAPRTGKLDAFGMALASLTPELRDQFELGDQAHGVVITDVDDNGQAAAKGLQAGDVIAEVDQHEVKSPEDVEIKIKAAKNAGYKVVTLLVYHQDDVQWVALRLDQG